MKYDIQYKSNIFKVPFKYHSKACSQ